jgi:CDP-paratose 2-epimerase
MAAFPSRILVTGGAGFVGSTIARSLKQAHPSATVVAMDNLKRRGSEFILSTLPSAGVEFRQGDVRNPEDFPAEPFDLLIECSAEASVLAGYGSDPTYLLQTNLQGAIHCLDYCRRHQTAMIFLSTSRVYSVSPLAALLFEETATRFELTDDQSVLGASAEGVAENFPTDAYRSLYGTTKLAAEMLIEEYRQAYGLKAVINRCGVLAGPWQLAKSDQGIFTFWLARHYFKRPLAYIGFNGEGKQVRDLLHAEDLAELVLEQSQNLDQWDGANCNVGGGRTGSLSLRETTVLCAEITGNKLDIGCQPAMRPMDIPSYISDNRRLYARTTWRPRRDPHRILTDTFHWLQKHEAALQSIL